VNEPKHGQAREGGLFAMCREYTGPEVVSRGTMLARWYGPIDVS
jgi:hypothetical protein